MPSPKLSTPGLLSRGPQIKLPRTRIKLPRTAMRLRGPSAMRTARGIVGLDIQPGLAVAVQAQPGGSLHVRQAAAVALDGRAMPEGEVGDEQLLTEALRELFRDATFSRRVRLGIANQRTVFRILELPPLSDRKELAAAVRFQAEDQLPMPLSNALFDFHSLGTFETPDGVRQRVAVVAAQRDIVERLTGAVRAAGLRPEGVDLSAFAMIRALHRREEGDGGQVLYLNVGGLTNIAIAEGTTCRFTRVTAGGLETMADRLANRLGVSLAEARKLIVGAGASDAATADELAMPALERLAVEQPAENLSRPAGELLEQAPMERMPALASLAPAPGQGGRPDGQDLQITLEQGIREIASEVRNSLEFHSSQQAGPAVSEVVVSGPALRLGGFVETLRAELGLKVTPRTIEFASGAESGEDPQQLAIAAGLTTEEMNR